MASQETIPPFSYDLENVLSLTAIITLPCSYDGRKMKTTSWLPTIRMNHVRTDSLKICNEARIEATVQRAL